MALLVEDSIWKKFPEMLLVVAYAEGIDGGRNYPSLAADSAALYARTYESWKYPNAQSHPHIAAWRNAFRAAMNLSGGKFPSSIESLAKRVASGKEVASIQPVVDFYNMVSVRFMVPVGGWDVDALAGGDIVLRHTKDGDMFTELGSAEAVPVDSGEVCYADAETLITRHFVWRQSERAKVTADTRRLFLVSEILPDVGEEVAVAVRDTFSAQLREYFGVAANTSILRSGDDRWDWA